MPVSFAAAAATAVVTRANITEAEMVAGGQTIIITLANDTWVAFLSSDLSPIVDNMVSDQSEATGWNQLIATDYHQVSNKTMTAFRTSDTVLTLTITAQAAFDITADETITVTVPGSWVNGASDILATPTFDVTEVAVVEDTTPPAGGWAAMSWYDPYLRTKKDREEERDREKLERQQLDAVDREIANILHKRMEYEARTAEIDALEAMIQSSYTKRQARLAMEYNDKVGEAYARAAELGTFSAVEAFEREMEKSIEEEEFLMLALMVLD